MTVFDVAVDLGRPEQVCGFQLAPGTLDIKLVICHWLLHIVPLPTAHH
jgi:hypothetical protein